MKCFGLLCLACLLVGCSVEAMSDDSPDAKAENASQVDAPAEEDVIVIDVRTKSEWDSGHVERAVHIPHTEIAERIGEVTTDKAAPIVVYCKVGGRAGKAKAKLEEMGFTNVENAGGFDDVKDRFQ